MLLILRSKGSTSDVCAKRSVIMLQQKYRTAVLAMQIDDSLHTDVAEMFVSCIILQKYFACICIDTILPHRNDTGGWYTVYPKKYAHGFCFAVLCCGFTLTDFPISIRLTSLALGQSSDCKSTLMNMDKYFVWIHYERLHNHNKAKHNKTVCIFLGIYCSQKRCCWWSCCYVHFPYSCCIISLPLTNDTRMSLTRILFMTK